MRTARIPLESPRWRTALLELGSLRLTLALLPLLALCVVAVNLDLGPAGWTLAMPLGLLAVNLACAIGVHPAFRTQVPLLTFHLALLAIVALAAVGRLTYLKGAVELSDEQEFTGVLTYAERGPWHLDALEQLKFASLGFSVHYGPGLKRAQTRNRVVFLDAKGMRREALVGDDTALKLGGYRFYTTSNKGFAPEFVWLPAKGDGPARGTIHMPSFPAQLARQELEWTPPGASQALTTRLEIDEQIVDLERPWILRLPREHALTVRAGHDRVVLRPGQSYTFAGGTLHYIGLRMWMGYSVFYDWTLPWILAACGLAVLTLSWHFGAKFRRTPWQPPAREGAS